MTENKTITNAVRSKKNLDKQSFSFYHRVLKVLNLWTHNLIQAAADLAGLSGAMPMAMPKSTYFKS